VVVNVDEGMVIFTLKVILCNDAYTNTFLPMKDLSLQTYLVYVVLVEIGENEVENLTWMPSIIWVLGKYPIFV
jgi:hypothetical protein